MTTLLVVGVGVTLLVPASRHQWALSLVRQPTPYTALSFDHPGALPTQVAEDQPLPVAFTIDNQEGRSIVYRYVVRTSSSDPTAGVTTATALVPAGRSRSVAAVIRPVCTASPCRVQVSLSGYPETIDFLANLVVPGGAPIGSP